MLIKLDTTLIRTAMAATMVSTAIFEWLVTLTSFTMRSIRVMALLLAAAPAETGEAEAEKGEGSGFRHRRRDTLGYHDARVLGRNSARLVDTKQ